MEQEKRIRVKAMCLIIHDGKILVADGRTLKGKEGRLRHVVPSDYYRVLGGSMEFYESSEEAVRREVREEIGCEIESLERLNMIENRYVYHGEQAHEVVFMFKGTITDAKVLSAERMHIDENDYAFDALWVPIEELRTGSIPLYPPGALDEMQ